MYDFDPEWLQKLNALRASGVEPYPNGMEPTHTSAELHQQFADVTSPNLNDVAIAGRLMFKNHMGKAVFLRVRDRSDGGQMMQVYVRKDAVREAVFQAVKALDIGDQVWAKGSLMRTRTGELTLQADEVRLAGKILTPFPDRWNSVTDVELRSRQRYVDLFMNDETRDTFRARSHILRYIRQFFDQREFLEVETPMMHPIPGGATARPFVTHHNALDMPLYLRIAPELYLKRLLVGGLERVFEINRSFRNEGISVRHNPEFTMLEFYQAWATMEDLIPLSESLLSGLVAALQADGLVSSEHGEGRVPFGDRVLDFRGPFRRADMDALIAEVTGLSLEALWDVETMASFWKTCPESKGASSKLPTTVGTWWELLFETFVEPTLVQPTFVTGFLAERSPLARRRDGDPLRVDRFELFINTWEIANAFSELNDPVDQAERFADQVAARTTGDDEAMFFDTDYIRALTYGMPPAAGQGFGIDRLVMLLTNRSSIREVILFPTLRPERP